jgi:UDP-N-acetyl-D-mannosaminuronate dehydrogenase
MILTEWDEFRDINLKELKTIMKGNLILDGRNIFEKKDMENANLEYISIGQSHNELYERKHKKLNESIKVTKLISTE